MSSKSNSDGMRDIKLVLHEIYPEDTFSADGTGSLVNENGIAWREKWVKNAMETIKDKSIRVEFIDDARSKAWGHGFTGYDADDFPTFEDAMVIGHFTGAEIQDVEMPDGSTHRCLVGIGVVDAMCYPSFVTKLENSLESGESIHGSVEILKMTGEDVIIYENGYHKESRTPQIYMYGGYAILQIKEADPAAIMLEINQNKEEMNKMTETEIKTLISQTIEDYQKSVTEMNAYKEACDKTVSDVEAERDNALAELNELQASSAKIQAALDEARNELDEKYKELDAIYTELETLRKELGEAKARERIGELNSAIARFSEEERAYAKDEIEAFNNDPITSEINSVTSKIWEGIGMAAKANEEKVASELNSANANIEDIFGDIQTTAEDVNIF